MIFRKAKTKDLVDIHALLEQAKLPFEDCKHHLKNFVVLEGGEKLIGVGGFEQYKEFALFRSIVIDSDYRSKGLGVMIFLELKQVAVKRGVKEIYLLTETAEKYFEKFKFVVVNRELVPEAIQGTEQFSSLCPASAVVMRLVVS